MMKRFWAFLLVLVTLCAVSSFAMAQEYEMGTIIDIYEVSEWAKSELCLELATEVAKYPNDTWGLIITYGNITNEIEVRDGMNAISDQDGNLYIRSEPLVRAIQVCCPEIEFEPVNTSGVESFVNVSRFEDKTYIDMLQVSDWVKIYLDLDLKSDTMKYPNGTWGLAINYRNVTHEIEVRVDMNAIDGPDGMPYVESRAVVQMIKDIDACLEEE